MLFSRRIIVQRLVLEPDIRCVRGERRKQVKGIRVSDELRSILNFNTVSFNKDDYPSSCGDQI